MRALLVSTFAVTLSLLCDGQKHGWDNTVCKQMPMSQNDLNHKRPYLPKQFSLRVEANIIDKNYTTDVREWYDEINNRGSLEQYDTGTRTYGYYDYDINELVVVTPLPNSDFSCQVTDLSQDPNRFIFGSKMYPNGTDRMFTAAGALRFGGSQPEKYMGVKTVRGIQCDMWQSCLYWQDMDATMTVNWYFTRTDWLTSKELPQVPVRCHVTGKMWTDGKPKNFDHIYEFSEYRDQLDGETRRFETPQGAYCKGMKTRLKPPIPAKAFSFGAEVQTPELQTIVYMKESYDQNAKLVRVDYQPNGFGATELVAVHDFNTGLAYNINKVTLNCTVTLIQNSGFDTESQGLNVRMRSSSEFFFTNKTSFIAYEGMRTVRGIECDVWIADKDNWPADNPTNSTWEWYFAKKEWQSNAGYSFESQMPVAIIITMHTDPVEHFHYNIYDYDETSPNIWNYDISSCYKSQHKQFFKILLKGNFTIDVLSDKTRFLEFFVAALIKEVNISPLRVADLDLDHNDKYIKVTFNLLDVAPFVGDIPNFPVQKPLATAVQQINQMLQAGTFIIPIATSVKSGVFVLTAIPFSADLWGYKMMTMAPLVTSGPDEEPEVGQAPPEAEVESEEVNLHDSVELQELLEEDSLNFEGFETGIDKTNALYLDEDLEDPSLPEDVKPKIYKRSLADTGIELSARELCQAPPAGYSSGALAGIAIGMLILGFFICFGAILLGSKYGTFASRNQGYEMT